MTKSKLKSTKPKSEASELTAPRSAARAGKEEPIHETKVRVIGIGGGGCSIISEIAYGIKKADFVAANTDFQALKQADKKCKKFQFGQALTRGLGCGTDPNLGARAAQSEKERISRLFKGIDLCVLVASLGGGTGSGSAPIFAEIARELKSYERDLTSSDEKEGLGFREGVKSKIIVIGIFTLPFKFEGDRKMQIARSAIRKMIPDFNALAIIPNEKIFQIIEKDTPLRDAFSAVNQKLAVNLEGLIETIYLPGIINIDFADFRAILDERGKMLFLNLAEAEGPNRSEEAIKKILESPLSEYDIKGFEKILFNIAGPKDLKMSEVEQISRAISDFNRRAKIIFGISQIRTPGDKIKITLLAIGNREERGNKKDEALKKTGPVRQAMSSGRQAMPHGRQAQESVRNNEEKKPVLSRVSKPRRKQIISSLEPEKKKSLFSILQKKPVKTEAKSGSLSASSGSNESKAAAEKTGDPSGKQELRFPQAPQSPLLDSPENLRRRSALDLRKETEEMEKKILAEENKWDIPAFLRRKSN